MLEVPDQSLASWPWLGYHYWSLVHPCSEFWLPILMLKMQSHSQEPPASSKAPHEDLKDMDVLCTFKIRTESQNLHHGFIKDQWLYPNLDEDANPQSETSSVLQSSKSGLKGHGCSLHLQNQDRAPKFGIWVYHRPVTISKSISGCQTPVRNLQHPPKPQIRT